jgi:hypothetical protein
MSENNQSLVVEHEGKFYVFLDIMAESWDDENELGKDEADMVFDKKRDAYAYVFSSPNDTEYGVSDRLIKDGKRVLII